MPLSLIVLMVIAAFAFVFFTFIMPSIDKDVQESGAEVYGCAPESTGFEIKHICLVANEVQLVLENTKNDNIDKFNVVIFGEKAIDEVKTSSGLTGFAIKKVYSNYDLSKTGPVKKIAIYPVLQSGSRQIECRNNVYNVENVGYCSAGCVTCKTKMPICNTAEKEGLCDGLDVLYGEGCRNACCVEHGYCCGVE